MKQFLGSLYVLLPIGAFLACPPVALSSEKVAENTAEKTAVQEVAAIDREVFYKSDKAPGSMLYDLPQPVIEGVCSGQVLLATGLYSLQYFSSALFGDKPSL